MITAPEYEGVVDLRRYPIGEPASQEYQALVRGCQDQLRDRGVARLDGFLTPDAVREMLTQASPAARARSRFSAASTLSTGSPRSAGRARGSTRC